MIIHPGIIKFFNQVIQFWYLCMLMEFKDDLYIYYKLRNISYLQITLFAIICVWKLKQPVINCNSQTFNTIYLNKITLERLKA